MFRGVDFGRLTLVTGNEGQVGSQDVVDMAIRLAFLRHGLIEFCLPVSTVHRLL